MTQSEIQLHRSVSTFNNDVKKLFLNELQKKENISLLLTRLDHSDPHPFCQLYIYSTVPSTFLCSPKDHNENKVYLDLYYAIPVTVVFIVAFSLYMLSI